MAVAISEQIALKVKQRLQLIDAEDGYETTVAGTVVRPTRIWKLSPQDYQLIFVQGQLERNPELSLPGNPPATAWNLPFTITGQIRPSEDDTTPVDALCNEFAADVIKALTDASDWYHWDSLAIDSMLSNVEHFVTDEMSGFRLVVNVVFRTPENDPYTVRA